MGTGRVWVSKRGKLGETGIASEEGTFSWGKGKQLFGGIRDRFELGKKRKRGELRCEGKKRRLETIGKSQT